MELKIIHEFKFFCIGFLLMQSCSTYKVAPSDPKYTKIFSEKDFRKIIKNTFGDKFSLDCEIDIAPWVVDSVTGVGFYAFSIGCSCIDNEIIKPPRAYAHGLKFKKGIYLSRKSKMKNQSKYNQFNKRYGFLFSGTQMIKIREYIVKD